MDAKYERGPTITRRTHKKNSSISWGERGLGMLCENKLRTHMGGLREELYPLFEKNRQSLPGNSLLSVGGVFGCWLHCPNSIADEVEAIVKRRHDEYRAGNYNDADLADALFT